MSEAQIPLDGYEVKPLSRFRKIIYGSGDWGRASYNTIRQFFYLYFLTNVVGLQPFWASFASVVGIIWDAVNDPIVGSLSDNVRTRWGRRRPFILIFAIPFALAFILLWWAPSWKTQAMLALHVIIAFSVADTLQTLVTVPYLSLTPEIASDYDDRTSVTTYRMLINLIASLVTAVAAPGIVDSIVARGGTEQQGYITVAAIFGALSIIPFMLIFFLIKERPISQEVPKETPTLKETLKILWQNTPFRFATGIYVLNWISVDIVAAMIPYFLLYWVAKGDILAKVSLFGVKLSLASAALGVMLITATLVLPFWNWLTKRFSKRTAYIIGILTWIPVQIFVMFIQKGQVGMTLLLAFLAGICVSSAHVIPEAIFPDVIDWDEVKTHARHEGLYYGAINFVRKLATAAASFLILQIMSWTGYRTPPKVAGLNLGYGQPESAITVIRILTGPFVAILLVAALVVTLAYPLSRDRQRRMHRVLERRRRRQERRVTRVERKSWVKVL
jgi:GPH family glycoside/pentoside/hexuronide:cation symporter